ncbi:hypothetical protein ES332_D04G071100v1 [Gossypium tomentosum]|uniref:Uncharacterized protein n=1 Tax=Gossypium tomentosum TaxID=34277 RepID=A0A5D2LA61_GOSTO|nr:hypothetical protein ES332_D04G071100v1 [Gossypium tomentosum]TYH76239.1 hypothetical protein ES332_D04G071100v1 [Gossypium tomentosum]TYH76240.1 hypothetical protein ES332_D04G071100v1 [Gossypium tomentosum]TYH76241.1 hypothetical protein ES332_D04G071100v1 [Gossypium tomentosum]
MPVSGKEEMGVKPSVGQFSEYTAGIPIKKRRFPFILSTENELEQKGFSSPVQGSTVSNDGIVAVRSTPSGVLVSSSTSDALASSNTSGVVASLNNSGILGSSKTSVINADGVTASLNAGSFATSSNALGVAMSSTAGSVASSSKASSAAVSSTSVRLAGSLNAGSVAESSYPSGVVMSSSAISVAAGSIASRAVENPNASSVGGSGLSFPDASEKSAHEKEKRSSDDTNVSMVQGNTNLLRVKLEEQSFAIQSRSLADISCKGKLVATGTSDNIMRKLAKSELDLVGNDSLTFSVGKDVYSQKSVDGKFGSQLPLVSGSPGLSLGLREYPSAMASGNNEQGFRNQEKTEPVSMNLSLSKGEGTTQPRSTAVQPNTKVSNMLADRTNWDLNTTMDYWEGPASDDGASKMATQMYDIKPVICSAGMTVASMPTQLQIPEEIENRAKIKMSSIVSSQQYSAEDSLRLGLTTPYLHLNPNEKPAGSSGKIVSGNVVANVSSPGEPVPASKPTMVNYKPVKSEPLDESVRSDSGVTKAKPTGLLNITQVKSEIIEKCSLERLKSSTISTFKSVDARSIKPEPVCESNKETPERMEGPMNQSDEQMLAVPTSTDSSLHGVTTHGEHFMQAKETEASVEAQVASKMISSAGVTTHAEHFIQAKETEPSGEGQVASQMISSADVTTHAEHFMQAKETEPSGEGLVASEMISSVDHDDNESNIAGKLDNSTSQSKMVEDSDHCKLKFMDVQLPDSRGSVEGSASDEEKINLSGDVLEEDSYGSDYESDDKRELATAMDIEHDRRGEEDFEDGEVREPVVNTEIEVLICEMQEAGNGNDGDNNPSSSSFREKETLIKDPGITSNDTNTNECTDTSVNKDSATEANKEACLQESSAVEMPSSQMDGKRHIKAIPRKSLDASEKDTVKGQEGEQASIQFSDTSQGTSVTISQGTDDAKKTDSEGKGNSVLPKGEAFSSGDDAGKDVDNGGNRSRIINLSRASNLSSPGRTRSISGRTLQSQIGRERLPDVALEGDKFHHRGRDEAYADSLHRFPRERHHVQPSRNNRISFMRGRDPNFSSYNNGQDGAYFGTGRGGRKILNDDPPIFSQLPPRRRSPGGRDGPAGRELPMVRRVPRNLSPSRCIAEDGSELVGLRHMRGFADDHTDPMFARCQPSFEGLDGPFVRGNREFTSVQRRGIPRTRSKSPTRQRTRSPGPWSSLRRRSPDGFGGPLELPHRRSPPLYRMERIRSPDRPCFAGEMGVRRHGSPPYLSRPSNDLRDLDPSRDHGHPRSGISNRSPSGRILLRNSRRLDLVDPQERNEGDDYFGGPMPSGRFHDLGTDGNPDERRRYGDRRGPVRPFRSPYSVADSENFHLNAEGGPRSFRFCPEDDPELHERGNMREREFDRRIKNRPGNAPRRTRNMEEQEGNFRHGGQVWHDDGFDDMSQAKRKRF